MFKSIYTITTSHIIKFSGKGSGWIIDSVISHNISISFGCPKYNPLAGSSYIKLLKELDHPKQGLINIQNIYDNECFKWCLVRYLNPADHHQERITKADKDFSKKLPTGQIYVRVIFVEHSRDIFAVYSEKVPYEIPGNIPKIMFADY